LAGEDLFEARALGRQVDLVAEPLVAAEEVQAEALEEAQVRVGEKRPPVVLPVVEVLLRTLLRPRFGIAELYRDRLGTDLGTNSRKGMQKIAKERNRELRDALLRRHEAHRGADGRRHAHLDGASRWSS
jgi:hypothetical protein